MTKIDTHSRFSKEEYDKIRLFAYYTNLSKNEIIRIAVRKLKQEDLPKNE